MRIAFSKWRPSVACSLPMRAIVPRMRLVTVLRARLAMSPALRAGPPRPKVLSITPLRPLSEAVRPAASVVAASVGSWRVRELVPVFVPVKK